MKQSIGIRFAQSVISGLFLTVLTVRHYKQGLIKKNLLRLSITDPMLNITFPGVAVIPVEA